MKEMDVARVVKGSVYLATQSLVTTLMGAVALAFMARILTLTEMAVTVVLTFTLEAAQILTDLGWGRGLTKHIAEYRGRNADYTTISFTGLLMKMMTASLAAAICVLAAPYLSELLLKTAEYALVFQLLGIDIVFICVNMTMGEVLLGLNKIREIAAINVMTTFSRQASAVVFLLYGYGLTGVVVGWIIGDSAQMILNTLIVVRGKHVKMHPIKRVATHTRILATFSWPLFLTAGIAFVYGWFDRALLLVYVPLGEVAVYSVAHKAFTAFQGTPHALSNTLFPYYSEQYGRDEQEKTIASVRATTRYITLLYTPLALGLVVTANPAITLFAGSIYASGDVILAILSFFGAVTSIGIAFRILLVVYNMTPTVLLVNIASIVVGIVMLPVLVPSLGAKGMAIVKGTIMIVSFVLATVALRRRIPIRFDKEAIWKSWSAAIVMLLAVWLIGQIYFSQYLLPIYILIGGVVYVIALRILKAVNRSDMQLIRSLMGNRMTFMVDILEKIFV